MSLVDLDLLAEVVIHIRQDGSYQASVSKLTPGPDPPKRVVQAVLGSGYDLAKLYGLTITGVTPT